MTTTDFHSRAMKIFDLVCDLPPEERALLLEEACDGNAALRAKVERMLAQDAVTGLADVGDSGGAADQLAVALSSDNPELAGAPARIGAYHVVRRIGQGGMGIIYEAEQESPRRRVALKILRPGLIGHEMLKRFEHEVHVLGQLQHPGIAHIHEAGLADLPYGRQPYFAMEYIEGQPLDRHAQVHQLDSRQRLELLARVCDAVQHAHQKGVIHRDLKPGNVLVTGHIAPDTSPCGAAATSSSNLIDAIGQPKVLDFGIARLTDPDIQTVTVQTHAGQLVGTLAYMSPEQVAGAADIDTRSDVYALGVMLYELLAGRRPHDLTALPITEAARVVREAGAPPVGSIDKQLRGDVETIVTKAMDKDRERRYGSVGDLAADIRRFLTDEPIQARRAGKLYLMGKFARRHTGLVAGLATTVVTLAVGLAGTSYYLLESRRQRDEARSASVRLRAVVDYQSVMLTGIDVAEMGQQILQTMRSEARASAPGHGEPAAAQLASFDEVLSQINATTVANRSLDQSIMSRAVAALDSKFADQPELQAELRLSVVDIYDAIGLPAKALAQARLVWEAHRVLFGADNQAACASQQRICALLLETGATDEAERTIRELLATRQRILGDEHVETLATRCLLGQALRLRHKYPEALAELQSTLAALQRTVGDAHPATMKTHLELGASYERVRDFENARRECGLVLDYREAELGPDHPAALAVRNRMAFLDNMLKRDVPAVQQLEDIHKNLAVTLGADHPSTLDAYRKLAIGLSKLGRDEQAAPLFMDLLVRQRRTLGPDHPDTLGTLGILAHTMLKLDRLDEAETYAFEAVNVAARSPSRSMGSALVHLAAVLRRRGHLEQYKQNTVGAVGEYGAVDDIDSKDALLLKHTLAMVAMERGMYRAASGVFAYNVSSARHSGRLQSPLVGSSMAHAALALIVLDRVDEARDRAEEFLVWCAEQHAEDATIGQGRLWVARIAYARADYDTARSALEAAVDSLGGHLEADDWPVCYARMLQRLIALRTGAADSGNGALEAWQCIVDHQASLRFPIHDLILQDTRRLLTGAGLQPDDSGTARDQP